MALESGTYISDLVITNPASTDSKSEGDNHLRLIKSAIKATFPNITGEVTATQAQINTAGSYSGAIVGRNKIINGNFGINQRAYVSGAATTAGQYTLDRWKVTGTGGVTFSTTANKTTVTIAGAQTMQQIIEGLNLESGTYVLSWEGTAQGRIAGGSYGASGTVTASITGGTDTTIEFNAGTVARVQLEIGTVATPFELRPIGLELALAQRYYYRAKASVLNQVFATGYNISTTQAVPFVLFPTTMRITPTALEQSGTATDYDLQFLATNAVCSSVVTLSGGTPWGARLVATVASGLTAGQGSALRASTTNAYLGFSAEL